MATNNNNNNNNSLNSDRSKQLEKLKNEFKEIYVELYGERSTLALKSSCFFTSILPSFVSVPDPYHNLEPIWLCPFKKDHERLGNPDSKEGEHIYRFTCLREIMVHLIDVHIDQLPDRGLPIKS